MSPRQGILFDIMVISVSSLILVLLGLAYSSTLNPEGKFNLGILFLIFSTLTGLGFASLYVDLVDFGVIKF